MAIGKTAWSLLFIVTLCASLIHEAYPLSELEVLLKFKNSFIDPNHALQNWDPKTAGSPCPWSGIFCDPESGKVTNLEVYDSNLTGQLVPELGQLSALESLLLYSNNIAGTIPVELGNLKGLVKLDLSWNKLTGKIPSGLGNLPKLIYGRFNQNGNLCWDFWPTPIYDGSYPLCQKK